MAKYYIKTLVEYVYESDSGEFASEDEAEQFGWNTDRMIYSCVDSIEVEELEDDEDDEDDEEAEEGEEL